MLFPSGFVLILLCRIGAITVIIYILAQFFPKVSYTPPQGATYVRKASSSEEHYHDSEDDQ